MQSRRRRTAILCLGTLSVMFAFGCLLAIIAFSVHEASSVSYNASILQVIGYNVTVLGCEECTPGGGAWIVYFPSCNIVPYTATAIVKYPIWTNGSLITEYSQTPIVCGDNRNQALDRIATKYTNNTYLDILYKVKSPDIWIEDVNSPAVITVIIGCGVFSLIFGILAIYYQRRKYDYISIENV